MCRSAIIGHDISGVVEERGRADVTEVDIGDEVYYTPRIFAGLGSFAEQNVAVVELVAHKPPVGHYVHHTMRSTGAKGRHAAA